ncbi:MAG: hypothetical protein R2697_04500 [Ilumatobacteraceae bacterium]
MAATDRTSGSVVSSSALVDGARLVVAVVGAGVVVAVSSTTDTSVDTTVLDGGRASL